MPAPQTKMRRGYAGRDDLRTRNNVFYLRLKAKRLEALKVNKHAGTKIINNFTAKFN